MNKYKIEVEFAEESFDGYIREEWNVFYVYADSEEEAKEKVNKHYKHNMNIVYHEIIGIGDISEDKNLSTV